MSKLESHQLELLNFIAASLFGGEAKTVPMTLRVIKEARKHTVLTLLSIDRELYPAFFVEAAQMLDNNLRNDGEHSELHRLMTEAGIPYVILKGCASAAYYPIPMFRCMGDVDALFYSSDLDKAGEVLETVGFSQTEDEGHGRHRSYHRCKDGIDSTWELHWQPTAIPKGNVGSQVKDYLSDMISSAHLYETAESSYMVPSDFHHGLVMLLHLAGHILNTGIGLRHLCDWAVFVAKFSDEEFCQMFEEKLKAVGLWQFAKLLTQLSIKYLHCPEKEWCGSGDDDYLEMMMVDIMNSGNFGMKDINRINQAKLMTDADKGKVDDTSLLKQLFRTMNQKARRGMPITKKVPILLPIGWIYVGGRHLLRIQQGKRPSIDVKDMVSGANQRKEIYKEFRLFEAE